jgi:hypothetical protein
MSLLTQTTVSESYCSGVGRLGISLFASTPFLQLTHHQLWNATYAFHLLGFYLLAFCDRTLNFLNLFTYVTGILFVPITLELKLLNN